MGEGNFIELSTTYKTKNKNNKCKINVDRVYKQQSFPNKARKLFGMEMKK